MPDPSGASMSLKVLLSLFGIAVAAIIYQQITINTLRETNRESHWKVKDLEQLQAQVAELPKLKLIAQEVEALRRNNQELNSLRNEVATSRKDKAELEQLRLEVARLRASQSALQQEKQQVESDARVNTQQAGIIMAKASEQCVNQLKQIGLAGRIWAQEHGETLPASFPSIYSLLNNPGTLVCPADPGRQPVQLWELLPDDGISYLLKGPGGKAGDPNWVFVECQVHGHSCLADGTVVERPAPEAGN